MPAQPWWKTAVVYQIYPRSFCDTDGDGIGDLEGVRRHVDHLVGLGVDAIWLSPIFPSPMADFGYDVSDYCGVDPVFGTLETLDLLIEQAHAADLKVILDLVPNHTSDQHPWFVESRSSPTSPKRDWYVWRDPAPDGGPPNNWVASFTDSPAWTLDPVTGQYYLHCFLAEQPDLDWSNPQVEAAMHDVVRFWLDRGIDGFRVDVVHLIGKDPELADDPADLLPIPHVALNHRDETHGLLRRLRKVFDEYPGDRMMVGEVYLLDTAMVATYYGDGDELHLSFNFPPLYTPWDAERWRRQIETTSSELDPIDAWPTWVLSNHDNRRHRTRYGDSEARARAAAVLVLTLRGTPFLYAGEELGLTDAEIPANRVVDPGGRDGCRAPIPWDATPTHGWASATPWLPWPPAAERRNAAVELDDPDSILHLYRRVLDLRRRTPVLHSGEQVLLGDSYGDTVLAWERHSADARRLVLVNMSDSPAAIPLLTGLVEVASDGVGEGAAFGGTLAPDQAVVIDPSRPG